MLAKIKKISACLMAAALLLSCSLTAFAADKLTVNSDVEVSKGDTVTYSLYLGDATEPVEGVQLYIYFDKNYLSVDKDSLKFDKFDTAVYNADRDDFVTFNWTNVTELADFSQKSLMVSVDFTVLKEGETDITYFIRELYGEDLTYLKSYKITSDIAVNGKDVVTDQTPIVNSDDDVLGERQGGFINYADGMGEDNSPNKDGDHEAYTGEMPKETQIISNVVDVTKTVNVEGEDDGSSMSGTTVAVIIVAVVVVIAIIAVIIISRKNKKFSNEISDVPDDNNTNS